MKIGIKGIYFLDIYKLKRFKKIWTEEISLKTAA